MIEPSKLLNPAYLFDRHPDFDGVLIVTAAILWATFVISSGLVWLAMANAVRRFPPLAVFRTRLTTFLFTTGFVGLILVFFRWQGLPVASSRIWLVVWSLITLIWLIIVVVYRLKKYPRSARLFEAKRQFERYLPRNLRSSKRKR